MSRPFRMVLAGVAVAALVAFPVGCTDTPHYEPQDDGPGTTYYVGTSGDDTDKGTSPDSAWRSLAHADTVRFQPGDRLLLEGGGRFPGTLALGPDEAGNPTLPVTIGSYGTGRATIEAAGTDGVSVHNTSGIEIRDLILVGDADAYVHRTGLSFFADAPGDRKFEHMLVYDVDASSFRLGLSVGGTGGSGFRDVDISYAALHGNKDGGLVTYGDGLDPAAPMYANEQVKVSNVEAFANPGDPTARDRHTGDGIVLGSVRGGTIQWSSAHDNGASASPDSLFGPIGIWAYDATGVVIQNSVSYRNHTGSNVDGGGFGLDVNVSASTMQYNLSFENDGAGFLVYTHRNNNAHTGDTVRFNISSNDARKLPWAAGIEAHGARVHGLQIYQNTVVMTGSEAPALRLRLGLTASAIRNNILVTDGSPALISDAAYRPDQVAVQGNDYHLADGPWAVTWGTGTTYRSLDTWRGASGQERLDGQPVGLDTDPCLAGGATPSVTTPGGAGLVVPVCDAVAGKGVDLWALGVDPGTVDYYGKPLGSPPVIGASNVAEAGGG